MDGLTQLLHAVALLVIAVAQLLRGIALFVRSGHESDPEDALHKRQGT